MSARTSRHTPHLQFFLRFLMHHIESQGISESFLRGKLRLEDGWLERSSYSELIDLVPRLVKRAESALKDPLLCLHVGERFHFCLAGLGGLVATHAPTPRLALADFARFVGGAGVLSVRTTTTKAETTFYPDPLVPWSKPMREKLIDGYFSSLVTGLRYLCGSSFHPLQVRLARVEARDVRSYERSLRSKVQFGAECDAITLRTAGLAQASLLYEPLLYEQLRFTADLSSGRSSGASPMRQLVEQAVRGGDHSIERVAETLRINNRTLQRRLQLEGATFRSVLKEVRVRQAEDLLLNSDLSLTAIAERLNYSDDKGLRKAIRQVTGRTPSEIRGEG